MCYLAVGFLLFTNLFHKYPSKYLIQLRTDVKIEWKLKKILPRLASYSRNYHVNVFKQGFAFWFCKNKEYRQYKYWHYQSNNFIVSIGLSSKCVPSCYDHIPCSQKISLPFFWISRRYLKNRKDSKLILNDSLRSNVESFRTIIGLLQLCRL